MASEGSEGGRFLALIDAVERSRRAEPHPYADAAFEAQLLGQPGQKRGLRGGPPVLEAARGAYLSSEFAGDADRRPAPGLLTVRAI